MTGNHAARITEQQVRELAAQVLPPRQLQAWRLHAGGTPTTRIAQILEVSERTARTHIDRANARLLAALQDQAR